MYDHNRSKGAHDLNKCKHLACSEVRASLFTDKCKVNQSVLDNKKAHADKMDSQKYCFKNEAIKHLEEKQKCAEKASQYVDYVFDECIKDKAPFNTSRSGNIKNFTNIF